MIKRIATKNLKPGMYVADLNESWIPLAEYHKEGRVRDLDTVKKILKRGIKHVYIDTNKGIDSADATPVEEIEEQQEAELTQIDDQASSEQVRDVAAAPMSVELERAEKLHEQALEMVEDAMLAAKNGKTVDVQPFSELADQMIDSVFRNRNALACLTRIRDKDKYLMEHSVNVSVLMSILGKELNLDRDYLHQCATGALLHDIGKIQVKEEILNKPEKLTESEFEAIKMHATYSKEILESTPDMSQVAINVGAQHHERIDGRGYPLGLKGDEISEEGKMAAVVDIYDAVTADRVYHKGKSPTNALKMLLEWSGTHLDKFYVQAFIKAIGVYPPGTVVELKSGYAGVVMESVGVDTLAPVVKAVYSLKSGGFIKPREIDLHRDTDDKILKAVSAEKYTIDVGYFLIGH